MLFFSTFFISGNGDGEFEILYETWGAHTDKQFTHFDALLLAYTPTNEQNVTFQSGNKIKRKEITIIYMFYRIWNSQRNESNELKEKMIEIKIDVTLPMAVKLIGASKYCTVLLSAKSIDGRTRWRERSPFVRLA